MERYCLIANPISGNGNGKVCLERAKALLDAKGVSYVARETTHPGHATVLAKEAVEQGFDVIVTVGGDGTLRETAMGVIHTDRVLGLLPCGTGNDYARPLGIPTDAEAAVDILLHGENRVVDAGEANGIVFFNIAGFGFDADVIYDVTYHPPHLFGLNVYILSLLKTLLSHKPKAIQVSADDGFSFNGKVFMVIAAICQYNGGGIREAKYAVPDDSKIDLIVVPAMRIPKVLKHMKDMTSGDHIDKIKEIRMTLTTQAEIHSDQLLRAETEGELLKVGDYHIKLIPNALNVLTAVNVPPKTA